MYVYVIKNKKTDKIYIGQTNNLKNRLKRHNGHLKNKVTSYTSKNKGEWQLVYKEEYDTRKKAIKSEKQLKSYQGRQYIKRTIMGR
ncbi:GIY-YIG nuclease family protein [Patescibacteria group bacterium]|nr:GIY-YIG nuclease family protein [Patescibacteria group bacterium]MCG2702346.1 GIY-YIG nuclease family protein [Candidatus Parcubacteria bacterium]MBU4264964.1 GIY-YIG nuclease family protein [Patescibacteria group bacterium]MBU4389801.1 GIY-YIG nuclease family protein [Patescibacteria group bacterium]MBU4396899.1 GIY-YIG nuclease family protein [Patescibacteria group bacterium]